MKRGEVVSLGPHRLMCGDSANPDDVTQLFSGMNADMVFCSPPYLDQRVYDVHIPCSWDDMMRAACLNIPSTDKTQAFFNLGLVHRRHEWVDYWHQWAYWMNTKKWLRLGWYVWDKMAGLPHIPSHGRLSSCHEFIFHFARAPIVPNKITPCVSSGCRVAQVSMRDTKKMHQRKKARNLIVHTHRIADTVTRATNRGRHIPGQFAHFPVALPTEYIKSYTQPGQFVYDPFMGSGTTMMAAEDSGRVAFGMEISPQYCEIAINRWQASQKRAG